MPDAPQSKRHSIPIVGPTPNQSSDYVQARPPPHATPHRTFELEPVKVAPDADPRRAATLPSLARQKSADGADPIPLIKSPRRPATVAKGERDGPGSLAPHESDSQPYRDASFIEGARRALGAVRWLVIGSALALVVALFALALAWFNRIPIAVRPVASSEPAPAARSDATPERLRGLPGGRVVIATPPSSVVVEQAAQGRAPKEGSGAQPKTQRHEPARPVSPSKGEPSKAEPQASSEPKGQPPASLDSASQDVWLE
jgi:hypothetical protein